MNGSDHLRPQPWLGRVVAEANAAPGRVRAVDHLAAGLPGRAPTRDGLVEWHGELRSGFRSNMLMGVASNRVDVKQAAARAERSLEQLAEPLSALFVPGRPLAGALPRPGLDPGHPQLGPRLDLRLLGRRRGRRRAPPLRRGPPHRRGSDRAGPRRPSDARWPPPAPVVVNPIGPRTRSGLVDVVVPAVGEAGPHVQVLSERSGLPGSITLDGETVRNMLGLLQGARIDDETYVTDVSLAEDETGLDVTLVIGPEPRDGRTGRGGQARAVHAGSRPGPTPRSGSSSTSRRSAGCWPARSRCPGSAGRRFAPAPARPPGAPRGRPGHRAHPDQRPARRSTVDPATGTFSLDGVPGYGRLVDGGDHGDTYNYSPPADDTVVDTPDVGGRRPPGSPDRSGPPSTIVTTYTWPEYVDGGTHARVGSEDVTVTTTLELRADEPAVRVRTRFTNPSRDHRLRVHLPLPTPATTSRAECAFTVVERGLTAEGRPEEFGLPTFPSRRFVQAGGLTVVHEGLLEYELVDVADGPDGTGPGRRDPGTHAAAGHRHAVAARDVAPPAAGRADGRTRRAPDARPGRRHLRPGGRRRRPLRPGRRRAGPAPGRQLVRRRATVPTGAPS